MLRRCSQAIRRGLLVSREQQRVRCVSFFNSEQNALLDQERTFLSQIPKLLEDIGASAEDKKLVTDAKRHLDELFLLVIVGEFNSGKSTMINALLGERLLADGVTPTTSKINVIKYGEKGRSYAEEDAEYVAQDLVVHRFPVEWLREINVVDTPGTNAVFQQHQILTEQFIPRSDFVIFVTSAERPFSASEKTFLQQIQSWSRRMLVVVNKVDVLETEEDKKKVLHFVRDNVAHTLQVADPSSVPVFGVAARRALRKETEPGFGGLQKFIRETLSGRERALIKLRSPLGPVGKVLRHHSQQMQQRMETLAQDKKALEGAEQETKLWSEGLRKEFQGRRAALDNLLLRLEQRSVQFLEETVTITNLPQLLMRRTEVRDRFDKVVLGDFGHDVERLVAESVDWMLERSAAHFGRVSDNLTRSISLPNSTLGGGGNSFAANRADLALTVQRSAQSAVQSFDRNAVANQLAETLRSAAMQFAAIELGAAGLASVMSAALVDVTGAVGVGAVAAVGLAVLPYRKRQQKAQMTELLKDLRNRLGDDLQTHFDRHLVNVHGQIGKATEPYALYVQAQSQAVATNKQKLSEAMVQLDTLSVALDKI